MSTETKSEMSQSSEDGETFTTFTFPLHVVFLPFPLSVPLLGNLASFSHLWYIGILAPSLLAVILVGKCEVTVWGTWVCMHKGIN